MRKLSKTEPLPEMSFSPLRLFKFSFVFYMLFLFIVTYLFICSSMFDTRMTQRVTVVSFTLWTLCRSESSVTWQTSVPSVVTVPCFIITKINQIWSVFLFDLMNTEQLFFRIPELKTQVSVCDRNFTLSIVVVFVEHFSHWRLLEINKTLQKSFLGKKFKFGKMKDQATYYSIVVFTLNDNL